MKNIRFLTFVLTIGTLLLSACGAAATAATPAPSATGGSTKVDAMPVSFVGIVDSMAGDQWVISGTTVTVDASIVRDGPFNVGDQVKVEGFVNPDGSFSIERVEAPTPQEVATLPPPSVDNSNEAPINANSNDSNANTNDDNSNSSNSNDSNTNDDNGGGNTNDDNSNDGNTNDDNGGGNTNDDNSNDSNSNDNDGGNSNDDNGGGNSNDDNGNDDNSGGGGGNDDSGGDDNGSGGNGNDD